MNAKGKKSAIRERSESIVDAYAHDVLTGDAPGITLADMIEVEMAEAVATAYERAAVIALSATTKRRVAAACVARADAIRAEVKP